MNPLGGGRGREDPAAAAAQVMESRESAHTGTKVTEQITVIIIMDAPLITARGGGGGTSSSPRFPVWGSEVTVTCRRGAQGAHAQEHFSRTGEE